MSRSIWSSSASMLFRPSASMSRRTPPILQEPKMTRPPVVASMMFRTRSRTRQECMNRLSKPTASAISPSQSRWLCSRESSPQMVRRYSARGGTGDTHDRLHRLAIGLAVNETADAADAFGNIDELDVVLLLDELLQAPVDEADRGARLDHLFVFHHQVEVDRLGQHRVLRAKGDDGAGHRVGES